MGSNQTYILQTPINYRLFVSLMECYLEDYLLLRPLNKKGNYDPKIEIKSSTIESFSEQPLLDALKEMYVLVDGRTMGKEDFGWLKQRLVDAALTLLDYEKHIMLLVGEDMQASFEGQSGNVFKKSSSTHPKNNRPENYALNVEHINFKVIL